MSSLQIRIQSGLNARGVAEGDSGVKAGVADDVGAAVGVVVGAVVVIEGLGGTDVGAIAVHATPTSSNIPMASRFMPGL